IDDADGDDFYDVGEGLAGVTVSLSGAAGNYTTTTWASGGWQIEVPSGSYTIKFSGGALGGQVVKTATLSGENVKVDANADDAVASGLRLTGGNSGETLNGGALAYVLDGRGGDDRLSGGGDADFLYGGVGADTLDGGANTASAGDAMFGGVGNDTYHVDSGLDLVDEGILFPEYGGGGFDTIISTADFFWDVHSAAERLVVSESVNDAGSDGVTAVGGVFDGTIEGHSGADILFGRGGSDVYRAGDGVDYISLSTLGLTDVNAYAGVDGVNTVVVEQRVTGAASWDIVFEFEAGKDKLDVSDYGYASAADVLARGFDDNAGNSYFALGDGSDYLFLVGVTKAAISEGDFIV
ncbi:MAG TPA: hypothetical protein PKE65_02885, partial [Rhizobiaceae bacterium]|nr:hypothetical protein [Rhizobiaceae bacterium]